MVVGPLFLEPPACLAVRTFNIQPLKLAYFARHEIIRLPNPCALHARPGL